MKYLLNSLLTGLFALLLLASPTQADAPREFDLHDAIQALADGLSSGQMTAADRLSGLGDASLKQAIERIRSVDSFRYPGFSALSLVEELFFLAESAEAGSGERFLGQLIEPLEKESAAFSDTVANDPKLSELKLKASGQPLQFADPTTLAADRPQPELPPEVRRAIDLIAEAAAGPTLFHDVMDLATRSLRLPNPPSPDQRIREAVSRSATSVEALTSIVAAHSPPPSLESAMQNFTVDVAERSAALSLDPRLSAVLVELANAPISPELLRLMDLADGLPSREQQRERTNKEGLAEDEVMTRDRVLAERGVETSKSSLGVGSGVDESGPRKRYESYVDSTMEPRDGATGGGVGANPVSSVKPTPRKYSTARLSPRAGRGVSVGAAIRWPDQMPLAAVWVQSALNPRFGRIAVATADGVFVSKPLLSDSVAAAVSTLWGEHGIEAEFREGEILIVASMDPETEDGLVSASRERIKNWEELRNAAHSAGLFAMANSIQDAILMQPYNRLVTHPATHYLELAWAAGRVDFWPSRFGELAGEISAIYPTFSGQALEFSGSANTWQLYERDGDIVLQIGDPLGQLEVTSRSSGGSGPSHSHNHFSITLFAIGDNPPPGTDIEATEMPNTWRLPGESVAADLVLDQLFLLHPDFIRVNHYAEALAILRWIDLKGASMTIFDSLGTSRDVPPPEWILLDRTISAEIEE